MQRHRLLRQRRKTTIHNAFDASSLYIRGLPGEPIDYSSQAPSAFLHADVLKTVTHNPVGFCEIELLMQVVRRQHSSYATAMSRTSTVIRMRANGGRASRVLDAVVSACLYQLWQVVVHFATAVYRLAFQ